MKLSKRIMPIVLVVAMLMSMVSMPVSATVTSTGTFWQEDFTGQEKNVEIANGGSFNITMNNAGLDVWTYDVTKDTTTDLSAYPTDAEKAAYQELVRNSFTIDGVKGLGGKAPFDTAFMRKFDGKGITFPTGYAFGTQYNRLGHPFNIKTTDSAKIIHYSFDYMSNGNYTNWTWWPSAYYAGETKGGYASGDPIKMVNGALKSGTNVTFVSKVAANQWYHIDMIFDFGNYQATTYYVPCKVYVNGTYANTTYLQPRGTARQMVGFSSTMFQGAPNTDKEYTDYFDNVSYELVATEPTIAPLALTSSNAAVVVNNTAKTVTLSSALSAADAISALSGTMVKSMAIKDAAGAAVESNALNGAYLCVNTTGNTTEYYTIAAPEVSGEATPVPTTPTPTPEVTPIPATPTPTPEVTATPTPTPEVSHVGSWIQNFDSYASGVPSGFSFASSETFSSTPASGAGNTPAFNKSLLLTNTPGGAVSNFEYKLGSSSVGYTVGSTEAAVLSFDYMVEGTIQPVLAWWYAIGKTGSAHYAGAGSGRMMQINANGSINVLNAGSGKSLTPGQWTHFDYVYRACDPRFNGASSIAVYIDGTQVVAPTQTTATNGSAGSIFAGLRTISFRPTAIAASATANAKTYIDNFSVSVVKDDPVIAPLSLTSNSESIVVDNTNKTVTLDSGAINASAVKAALSATTAKAIDIKNASGVSETGYAADGEYVCVNTTGNTTVYYTIIAPPAPPSGGEIAGDLVIDGTLKEGYTLSANIDAITPAGVGPYLSYEWKSGDTVVGTEKKYTLTSEDVGKTITLTVTAGAPCTGTVSATTEAIAAVTEVIGIESADVKFDNKALTIVAPTAQTAAEFYDGINLYPMHTGKLVYKTTGEAVADTYAITPSSQDEIIYRVTAGSDVKDYVVTTRFVWQDFETFAGTEFKSGGTTSKESFGFNFADSTSYAKGVTENSNTGVSVFGDTARVQLRRDGLTAAQNSNTLVFGFDFMNDNAKGQTTFTVMYTNKAGASQQYNDFMYFKTDKTVSLSNGSVNLGTWEPGKLYKVKVVMDYTTQDCRVFFNGEARYTGKVNGLSNVGFWQNLIWATRASGEASTNYFDNIVLYPIASVAAFDGDALKSDITSDKVLISAENVISGYGAVTVADFAGLVTVPAGATAVMYNADGTVAEGSALVAKGMKYVVNAKEAGYSSTYTIGDAVDITGLEIRINTVPVKILYPGIASAKADVYVQNATDLTIKLEKIENGEVTDVKEVPYASVVGEKELAVALDNEVEDKPGTSLVLSVLDAAGNVLATKTVSYSEFIELSSEIVKAKDNAKGIYTMTMDDGYMLSTQNFYQPWFEKYDLRGTTVAVYNCFAPNGSTYTGGVTTEQNKAYFREALTQGHLEIGSHSNTHPTLTGVDAATLRSETIGSIATLEKAFPGQQILTFTNPGNASNDATRAVIKEGFYAMRGGDEGSNNLENLSLSTASGNMYNLKIRRANGDDGYKTTGGTKGVSAATMNGWLDNAVANGEWVVEMWHTIAWKKAETDTEYYSDGGYVPLSPEFGEAHMAHASELQASGDLWVATFNEATKYQQERLTSTLTDIATRTSRTIKLTDTLDNDVFNYPLTIKSEVPSDWKYATVTQDGRVQTVAVVIEDSASYIYYEATPDRGDITIASSSVAPAAGKITAIDITSTGSLEQMDSTLSEVSFAADVTADGDYQVYDVEWFVNGVKQYTVGKNFAYTPASEGSFGVMARATVKQSDGTLAFVESDIITIEVGETPPPPEYNLVNETFEDKTVGATLSGNTDAFSYIDHRPGSKCGIYTVADPKDANNIVVQYKMESSGQQMPFVDVKVDSTKPIVISGKTLVTSFVNSGAMVGVRSNTSQGYLSSDGTFVSLLSLCKGGVISYGDKWFNGESNAANLQSAYKWKANEWIRYDIYLNLNQTDMTKCSAKVVLSGGVTDASGNYTTAVIDIPVIDLSNAGAYLASGKITVTHGVNINAWTTPNDTAYLDDVKIYQQQRENQALTLDNTTGVSVTGDSVGATLVFDIDATTLSAEKINVSDGENTVHPSSITFDAMTPNKFVMTFDEGLLAPGTEYTVSFDSSVKDLFGTSESSTATFMTEKISGGAETPSAKLTVNVEGDGNVTDAEGNAASFENKAFDLNTAFELTATALEGYEFSYWLDMDSGRIVSEEATYSFTLVSDKKLKAVFTNVASDAKTVIFKNKNGQIASRAEVAADGSITVPADPMYMGYEFAGWKLGGQLTSLKAGDTVSYADLAAGENIYEAYFTKNVVGYTLSIVNGKASPAKDAYNYDDKITISANDPESGMVFSHWIKDDEVVSYDNDYSFFMGAADTAVEAKYDTEAPVKAPTLIMTTPVVLEGKNRVAFFAERNLYADEENGRELIETGIIVNMSTNDFDMTTAGTLKATSTSKAAKGQFTVRKAGLDEGDMVYAKAYMIYSENGEIKTVFSNVVTGEYTVVTE